MNKLKNACISILTALLLFCGYSGSENLQPGTRQTPEVNTEQKSDEKGSGQHAYAVRTWPSELAHPPVETPPEPPAGESVHEVQPEPAAPVSVLSGKVIVVDAGHGISSYKKKEAIAPGSNVTKAAFVSGTSGKYQTEEQLNLSVALKLRAALEAEGAVVHMTRTEHACDVSNIDRAQFANVLNADISVKLHADGSNSSAAHGVSVLVPGPQYIGNADILNKSRTAGELVLQSFVQQTGAANRGISVRNDLTGFNWTQVPIILIEMGFMTNPDEDRLLATADYQDKMVSGIVLGLKQYFG